MWYYNEQKKPESDDIRIETLRAKNLESVSER